MGNKGNISEDAWAALSAIEDRGGTIYLSMARRANVEIHNTAIRELLSCGFVAVRDVGSGRCVEITPRGRVFLHQHS